MEAIAVGPAHLSDLVQIAALPPSHLHPVHLEPLSSVDQGSLARATPLDRTPQAPVWRCKRDAPHEKQEDLIFTFGGSAEHLVVYERQYRLAECSLPHLSILQLACRSGKVGG